MYFYSWKLLKNSVRIFLKRLFFASGDFFSNKIFILNTWILKIFERIIIHEYCKTSPISKVLLDFILKFLLVSCWIFSRNLCEIPLDFLLAFVQMSLSSYDISHKFIFMFFFLIFLLGFLQSFACFFFLWNPLRFLNGLHEKYQKVHESSEEIPHRSPQELQRTNSVRNLRRIFLSNPKKNFSTDAKIPGRISENIIEETLGGITQKNRRKITEITAWRVLEGSSWRISEFLVFFFAIFQFQILR